MEVPSYHTARGLETKDRGPRPRLPCRRRRGPPKTDAIASAPRSPLQNRPIRLAIDREEIDLIFQSATSRFGAGVMFNTSADSRHGPLTAEAGAVDPPAAEPIEREVKPNPINPA
ncbi:MAG: hypothetical protein AUK55_03430 [Syntrophobacteraceae bacterium CG2_30_61_12]|nr:MAG: hypothetical protein AUK55_03430 [Syntrophobacteraceae bacterium CG2_30_61_12]PIU31818.1 MAG: hypothetical protein COT06_06085 [Syntrophobacteraceae bacterium CG07_land_8_20_14_0_80_61_8]